MPTYVYVICAMYTHMRIHLHIQHRSANIKWHQKHDQRGNNERERGRRKQYAELAKHTFPLSIFIPYPSGYVFPQCLWYHTVVQTEVKG